MIYKTVSCMFGTIEETLNLWCKRTHPHDKNFQETNWKLVQIIAFPEDMGVTIILEKR